MGVPSPVDVNGLDICNVVVTVCESVTVTLGETVVAPAVTVNPAPEVDGGVDDGTDPDWVTALVAIVSEVVTDVAGVVEEAGTVTDVIDCPDVSAVGVSLVAVETPVKAAVVCVDSVVGSSSIP